MLDGLTGARVVARVEQLLLGEATGRVEPVGTRDVYWEPNGFRRTDIYDGAALGPGADLMGPAIVEEPECTIIVPPGAACRVDPRGNLIMTTRPGARP